MGGREGGVECWVLRDQEGGLPGWGNSVAVTWQEGAAGYERGGGTRGWEGVCGVLGGVGGGRGRGAGKGARGEGSCGMA